MSILRIEVAAQRVNVPPLPTRRSQCDSRVVMHQGYRSTIKHQGVLNNREYNIQAYVVTTESF